MACSAVQWVRPHHADRVGLSFPVHTGPRSWLPCRNVTLRGPAGRSPDDRPVLDMKFTRGALQLCSTCVFTLQDLVLANDRVGTGPAYDLFTGVCGLSEQCCEQASAA